MKIDADLEARMLGYLEAKMTMREIALLEGQEPVHLGTIRREVARKHGLSTKGKASAMPPGLTEETRLFRKRLGDLLYVLKNNPHNLSRKEAAKATGVSSKNQTRAETFPYTFNWSIAEIEQLARALNMSFNDVILHVLTDPTVGFK
jgi:hypothetical protein